MTLEQLNKHIELCGELAKSRELLKSYLEAAQPGAPPLTGMPHGTGVSDKVGNLATDIADLETSISELEREIEKSEGEINAFIATIPSNLTKAVFRLRFLRCYSWGEVAHIIKGGNTADSAKKICYRYLEQIEH